MCALCLACKALFADLGLRGFFPLPYHKAPFLYSFVYQATIEWGSDVQDQWGANDNGNDNELYIEGSDWDVSSNNLHYQVGLGLGLWLGFTRMAAKGILCSAAVGGILSIPLHLPGHRGEGAPLLPCRRLV